MKKSLRNALRREFEILEMKKGETITDYFARVLIMVGIKQITQQWRRYARFKDCGEDLADSNRPIYLCGGVY